MDAERFDSLSRTLTDARSRRGALAALLGSPLGLFGFAETAAKKKRKKKKKKKSPVRCTPQCAGKVCGDDGCGATCGVACGGGQVCQDGRCVCANGGVPCLSRCCAPGQVCLDNASCATVCMGETCPAGCSCSFASVEGPQHCGALVSDCGQFPQECTSTAQCPPGQHCQETTCPGNPKRCFPLCGA
jgi:hypothetical protein